MENAAEEAVIVDPDVPWPAAVDPDVDRGQDAFHDGPAPGAMDGWSQRGICAHVIEVWMRNLPERFTTEAGFRALIADSVRLQSHPDHERPEPGVRA